MDSSFSLKCAGSILSGNFGPSDFLYCKYVFQAGEDWKVSGGIDTGLSQTACKNNNSMTNDLVWNFPIDISYTATNVFGWPRIAISVYGVDFLGRDVVKGYGSLLIPLVPGHHEVELTMYTPQATSVLHEAASWLFGNPPEVILHQSYRRSMVISCPF